MFAHCDGGSLPEEASGGPSAGVLIITETDGTETPPSLLVVSGEEAALTLSHNSLCFIYF